MSLNIKLKSFEKKPTSRSTTIVGLEVSDKRLRMCIDSFIQAGGAVVSYNGVDRLTHSSFASKGTIEKDYLDNVYCTIISDRDLEGEYIKPGWYLLVTTQPLPNCVKPIPTSSQKSGKISSVAISSISAINLVAMSARIEEDPVMNLVGLTIYDNLVSDLIDRGVYRTAQSSKKVYKLEFDDPIIFTQAGSEFKLMPLVFCGTSKDKSKKSTEEVAPLSPLDGQAQLKIN